MNKAILIALAAVLWPLAIPFIPLVICAAPFVYFFFLRPLPPKKTLPRSTLHQQASNTRRHPEFKQLQNAYFPGVRTLDGQFAATANRYASSPCLGYRPDLGTIERIKTEVKDGVKSEKKLKIAKRDHYVWQTYGQVLDEVHVIGSALSSLGLKPEHMFSIYSETRPEWMKTAQACFAYSFPVVTVYASLGEDALSHSFDETRSEGCLTNAKLLPGLIKLVNAGLVPSLRFIVYTDADQLSVEELNRLTSSAAKFNVRLISYEQLLELGRSVRIPPGRITQPDQLAVIMYTSGSTGKAKGVMISHANLVAAICGGSHAVPGLCEQDTYIAFLPLAHVLELMAENAILAHGGRIGYSNPQTLTDETVINANGKPEGDFVALKPTLSAGVPLLMDRMRKSVLDKVNASPVRKLLFKYAYALKRRNYLAGRTSPILDMLIFSKIHKMLGGKLRLMLSGGAPLSGETQEFMNVVFGFPIGQGYGLTETCGGATISNPDDVAVNQVGGPLACSLIKFVDVPEMGYFHSDQPNPRGEVWIGGDHVTMGYFKDPKKTAEEYSVDENGQRWFKTGDIGRWNSDGTLSIVDRKKDLVKLQQGEYLALGHVEATLKSVPLVENICVHADSMHNAPVALVVPNRVKLSELASSIGAPTSWPAVCKNPLVIKAVLSQLQDACKSKKLKNFETPSAIKIVEEEWSPAMGLLTEAMKLKRNEIYKFYQAEIKQLYHK